MQTISCTYAEVLTQTDVVAERGGEQKSVGTETTDDEEMIDTPVPKPKPKPTDCPSNKDTKYSSATGHTARAYVVHGVACLGPMATKIQEVEREFGQKEGEVIGVQWQLKDRRRWGKAASLLVVFLTRAVPIAEEMYVRMRGRKYTVVKYEWDRGPGRVASPW